MNNCKKCGRETGPAFAMCVDCIHEEDGTRRNYIEFRVYVHADADATEVFESAEEIQMKLADLVSDDMAPDCFNQDVTYTIRREQVFENMADARVTYTGTPLN